MTTNIYQLVEEMHGYDRTILREGLGRQMDQFLGHMYLEVLGAIQSSLGDIGSGVAMQAVERFAEAFYERADAMKKDVVLTLESYGLGIAEAAIDSLQQIQEQGREQEKGMEIE